MDASPPGGTHTKERKGMTVSRQGEWTDEQKYKGTRRRTLLYS